MACPYETRFLLAGGIPQPQQAATAFLPYWKVRSLFNRVELLAPSGVAAASHQ
ncbi:MAG TPA: hypothetical protein IGS52_20090 [Oscillatoriaceae cyanobacterium M33_DOE_052]|nr:hypothetical protein [Oscillatoriaceae cyanobacterium M33_DOE_052]